jgi:hypothetical protein
MYLTVLHIPLPLLKRLIQGLYTPDIRRLESPESTGTGDQMALDLGSPDQACRRYRTVGFPS